MENRDTRFEFRAVSALQPPRRTARVHPAMQLKRLARSIERFGFVAPIVITGAGEIIAGEARWRAAHALDLAVVPVVIAEHLSGRQVEAYRIADNRLAEDAEWDEAILATIIQELDLELPLEEFEALGFREAEVDRLLAIGLAAAGGSADDDAPALPEVAATRRGDIWLLGDHRLRCGDSTVVQDVAELLGDVRPHLMVTDPPYGVKYDPSFRNELLNRGVDSKRLGAVLNDDRADWREAWALFPGDVAYVWHAALRGGEVEDSLRACAFEPRSVIIWAKTNFAIGRGHYHWQHEPCLYAVRQCATGHWQGARDQATLWRIAAGGGAENAATEHGTQKPVECMRRPMLNNSRRGDWVYEPFGGSGSSIIAAETIERRCLAMELSESYCDTIVRRWQTFTGRAAMLEASGVAFAAVAEARRA